jgi:hypothetical protein
LTSSSLALWAAKDLNLFAKYRLDVDFVYIAGGPGVMQSLIGGNTQSADTDAVVPVHFWRISPRWCLAFRTKSSSCAALSFRTDGTQ